jgi:hypothetical protein
MVCVETFKELEELWKRWIDNKTQNILPMAVQVLEVQQYGTLPLPQ